MKKRYCIGLTFLFFVFNVIADEIISYNGSGNFELTEKTDLRRYDNGKYVGLVSREISSFIVPVSQGEDFIFKGNFYLVENTKRNLKKVGFSLDETVESIFKIDKNGQLTMIEDNGFPSYRSFPTYPKVPIHLGNSWEGKAERAVDPLNKGIITKMPVYVSYTYSGDSIFYGEDVFVITAKWATRYGVGSGSYNKDWNGDQDLEKAIGTHNCKIYVSKKTGNGVLIQDRLEETYFYKGGKEICFKGTVSQFTKYPPAVDRKIFIPVLKRVAELSDQEAENLINPYINNNFNNNNVSNIPEKNINNQQEMNINNIDIVDFSDKNNNYENNEEKINVKVENTPGGIKMTIENLRFLPDSSELVPGQMEKISEICEVLKAVKGGRFLIEGHTAKTGNEKGEMKLSLERAEKIAQEFISRGLEEGQFICKGAGGSRPIGDNSTDLGRRKNRRVEITILE